MRFKRGLELFNDGEYKLALVEFERAYELAPNFRALYNVALVNIQLGRYAEATRKFQAYLHDGGDDVPATRRAEVLHTLSELELRTANIDVSSNVPGTQIELDGKPISFQLPGTLLIDAGEHTISATAPGYDRVDKSLTLAGTDHTSVRFNLVPIVQRSAVPVVPEAPVEGKQHLFLPGLVSTGALAVGGVVSFGIMLDALSSLHQLQNTVDSSEADRQSYANRANTAAVVADVLGGLAVASGAVTLYVSLRTERSPRANPAIPSAAFTPRSANLVWSF